MKEFQESRRVIVGSRHRLHELMREKLSLWGVRFVVSYCHGFQSAPAFAKIRSVETVKHRPAEDLKDESERS